jgi:hypothetical protein
MSEPSNSITPEPAGADDSAGQAGPASPSFFERVWPHLKPYADPAWLNLRVWVPFLANPDFRASQVLFGAKDFRDGRDWKISLPRQCWQCGTTSGLMPRQYEKQIRTFEAPVGIAGSALGLAVFALLLALWLSSSFFSLVAFCLIGGAVFLFVKSWIEHVEFSMWTCPTHADELRCPDMVVHENEVHVLMPWPKLAEATRQDILERRKNRDRGRYGNEAAAPSRAAETPIQLSETREPSRAAPPESAKPSVAGYKRDELPPIKLDD